MADVKYLPALKQGVKYYNKDEDLHRNLYLKLFVQIYKKNMLYHLNFCFGVI